MAVEISQYVSAVAALGTAAYGLVDSTKAFAGGVSNAGFKHIKRVVGPFFNSESTGVKASELNWSGLDSVLRTLHANWINGVPLADQKAFAKSLIKLRLSPATVGDLASATGIDAAILNTVAAKIASVSALTKEESDAYGRFDFVLTAILDEGYQRADQTYRNTSKILAIPFAVALALIGDWWTGSPGTSILDYASSEHAIRALLVGLIATPLAPVAKDLSSALAAGVRAAQLFRR